MTDRWDAAIEQLDREIERLLGSKARREENKLDNLPEPSDEDLRKMEAQLVREGLMMPF